ncbi:MAG: ParB/RepB/Spo0J family partition protein [Oscillospiraceae bacterium]|nr:ParB/RepB/Spo0J family partition protein [Oscillospiraceae bacterium]
MNNAQFNLNAMLSNPTALQNNVKPIPCDMLIPYHNHKFEMYSGERLDDMISSIRENGVLCPIIVQPADDGKYEILIGHNRWNACKIEGLPTVPAIIKENLSQDEAEMYVIESNLMQRGFENLRISEQAAVIAERHKFMFSQGKRNDIIRELERLENPEISTDNQDSTLNPVESKLDSSREVGTEYGMSKASVIRLIRIDKLIKELKILIDSGEIAVRTGVELSFLSEEVQKEVAEQAENFRIDIKTAKKLHESADENGSISNTALLQIIAGVPEDKPKPKSVKISNDVFSRYFGENTKKQEVADTIEKALAYYFANREDL